MKTPTIRVKYRPDIQAVAIQLDRHGVSQFWHVIYSDGIYCQSNDELTCGGLWVDVPVEQPE